MLFRRESIAYRLVDIFFRNWRTFLICVFGVSSVVGTALVSRNESYSATASIRVIRDNGVSQALGFTNRSWESPSQQNATHFNDLMHNVLPGGFVSKVLERAKLNKPINIDPGADDKRFAAFRKNVFAGAQSQDVFQIGLVWDNPQECERLVKALQESFIEDTGLTKQAEAIATSEFLNSQIGIYKKRLQSAEQALMDFKRLNAGKLPDAQQAEVEQLANLKMERDYLAVTSQDNALKQQSIKERMAQIKPVSILETTVSTDPNIVQIRELQAKRNSLIAQQWLPTSDPVKEIDQQISSLKNQITRQQKSDPNGSQNVMETKLQDNPEYLDLNQQLTQATIDERAQKARVTLLNTQIAQYEARIQLLPAAERALVEKTRDREVIQKQYNDLWERREQALLKANVDRVTATSAYSVQNAIYAEQTVGKTKKLLMVVASVLLGVVVGCLVLLLKDWLDPSFRYEMDVTRFLGVPVLALLPESQALQFPVRPARGRGFLRPRNTKRLPEIAAPTSK